MNLERQLRSIVQLDGPGDLLSDRVKDSLAWVMLLDLLESAGQSSMDLATFLSVAETLSWDEFLQMIARNNKTEEK
jgi:hypothetical protein